LGLVVGVGRPSQQLRHAFESLLALRPALVELLVITVERTGALARPASGELANLAHHPLELLRDVARRTAHVPGGAAKFAGGDGETTAHAGLLLSWGPMTEHPDGRIVPKESLTSTCVFCSSSLRCRQRGEGQKGCRDADAR